MKNLYNEDYYERGVESGISGYSNFRWMPELTIPMCARLVVILNIKDNETILDFGCAKGYIVKAFRLLYKQAWGVDISKYAISNAASNISQYLYLNNFKLQNNKLYDWIIAKDVFEHIPYDRIDTILTKLNKSCIKLYCMIPLGEHGKYIVPCYEQDETHIIRESLDWWENKFHSNNFEIIDSSYSCSYLKSNYKDWKKGNGFLTLATNENN